MKSKISLSDFNLGTATILIGLTSSTALGVKILSCNPEFSLLSGLEAAPRKNIAGSAFGSRAPEVLSELLNLSRKDSPGTIVLPFQPTGNSLLSKTRANEDGSIDLVCFDITSIQREMEYFRFQEIGYRHFVQNFQGMAFQRILKPEPRSVFTAGAFEKMTGYSIDQGKDTASWAEVVHPEDRNLVLREGKRLLKEEGYSKELEYRIIRKDGTIRWLHSYDRNFLSDDGSMQMMQGLVVDITDRKNQEIALQEANRKILEQNARLKAYALSDPLTGLANRRNVQQILNYMMKDYDRTGTPFSLMIIDLDHFKRVNDMYGHDAGDTVLCGLAESLQDFLRKTDIKARWGGEEFMIILPRTGLQDGIQIAEKLRKNISDKPFSYKGNVIPITFSGGIASCESPLSIQKLICDADRALYAAKEAGRNRIIASGETFEGSLT